MKKSVIIIAVVALASLFCIPMSASSEMREGKWEITSSMDMPGMPTKMPPTVIQHCYTKEDVKDEKKLTVF